MTPTTIANGGSRRILVAFAHPDDETFACGGTLAQQARQGAQVTLVCATRGEAGEIADPALATPETLGQVREEELRCAARTLGLSEVLVLGYRDSGMAGTASNHYPQAYMHAPDGEVVATLVRLIRRQRPHAVITFDPSGVYGHPDHVAIHRHTLAAFHAAADATQYPDAGEAWQPGRLLYIAFSRSFNQQWREELLAAGVSPAELTDFDNDFVGCADDQVHIVVDVSEQIDTKVAAFYCHRTQFGSDNHFRRLPEPVMRRLISQESFTIGWPQPAPSRLLADLFAEAP